MGDCGVNLGQKTMARRGMSLIELLVALGIIAVLLAIALPVVQYMRESARRVQCQSNLRQILLATQSHHASNNALPSFYNGTSLPRPLSEWDLFHTHSWRVPLLPYLEQSSLKDRIDWEALATAPANLPVAQTVVPVFICPTGGDPGNLGTGLHHGSIGLPPNQLGAKDYYRVVRSDYDAMAGIQVLPDPLPANASAESVDFVRWGIWGWPVFQSGTISNSRLTDYRQGKFSDVSDGLSNTIALVERAGKPIEIRDGKPNRTSNNPNAEYPGQVGWSASNTFAWALNGSGVGVNHSNSRGIYSFHSGGAFIGVADGSVRFLSNSTDFRVLVSLYGRSDGGLPE